MKLSHGALLAICGLGAGCVDEPEYSVVPSINYSQVCFHQGTSANPTSANPVDSLILTITFRDGDGDLGLSDREIDEPFHDVFYAIANDGKITDVAKESRRGYPHQFIKVPPGSKGKLVTNRTLQDPTYAGSLPPFIDEFASCTDYKLQTVYVREEDSHVLDNTYLKIDTVYTALSERVFVVQDVFYQKKNPNHDNIEVEFWVMGDDGEYTLFDWEKQYCESGFDQRFPILAESRGMLEGELEYAMTSVGIRATFGSKTLKLRIRIRDRAFNVSNKVESQPFTLDKIKC